MIQRLFEKLSTTLYIQIWENRIKVIDIETLVTFDEKPLLEINGDQITAYGNNANSNAINPFSHPRVIFSDFIVAEKLLQIIISKVIGKVLFKPKPYVIIQPMEKIEGGLTQIEIRAFRELTLGAGARDSVVITGKELQPHLINFKEIVNSYGEQ